MLEKREKGKKKPTQKPKVSTGCFAFTEPLFFSLHGGVGAAESHIHRQGFSLRFCPKPHLRGIQLFWLLPINSNQVSFVRGGSCKARRREWMTARLYHYSTMKTAAQEENDPVPIFLSLLKRVIGDPSFSQLFCFLVTV